MYLDVWERYVISDLIHIIGGGTPKTSIGEYWNGDIPWLSVKDFNNNYRKVYSTEKKITQKGLENSSTKLLEEGDLIISARGTVGALAQLGKPMAFNQSCYGIKAKKNKITNDFLYYLLKHKITEIKANTHGSIFDTITTSTFDILSVVIPKDLNEQKAISATLAALDDKIELNNRINKTLKEMAQAIFKQWFIDFDFPDENGQPYKSSGGEMGESELGLIPKGWKVGKLSDICSVLSGGTPKTSIPEYWDGDIPFFTPKDVDNNYYVLKTEKTITEDGLQKCNSKLYPKDTVFITARGTVGKVVLAGRDMAMNQSCYALKGKNELIQYFLFFQTLRSVRQLKKGASGAVFDAIVVKTFDTIKITIPSDEILALYNHQICPLLSAILLSQQEIVVLASIRDSLLPKLMSGEIRVPIEEV